MVAFNLVGVLLAGVLVVVVSLLQAALDLCGKVSAPALGDELLKAGLRVSVVLASVGLIVALWVAFDAPMWLQVLVFGLLLYAALKGWPRMWIGGGARRAFCEEDRSGGRCDPYGVVALGVDRGAYVEDG